jgi:hypothetical protein
MYATLMETHQKTNYILRSQFIRGCKHMKIHFTDEMNQFIYIYHRVLTNVSFIINDISEFILCSWVRVNGYMYHLSQVVRFEVFTAVTMKNGVFWDVTPCGSCKNRRFGGTWRLLHQSDKNR